MKKYLVDTNIAIFYMKGKFNLSKKFDTIPTGDLFISEISLAELKFGVEKSEKKDKNTLALQNFLNGVQIIPIYHCLDFYAAEKARLQKKGILIDDFDLLIGSTAVVNNLTLVTNNVNHLKRINGVKIEDWTL